MAIERKDPDFFVVGSALTPDSPGYVQRPGDDLLFEEIQAGNFCYVLAAPRLGKSSLLIRTASRLNKQQIGTATIYLSGIQTEGGADKWYLNLVTRLQFLLKLDLDANAWWGQQAPSSPAQRFIAFLRQHVLATTERPVVIFIDEVEALLGSKFAADFLVTLRSVYEDRATDSIWQRLTFVLSGVATPTDLIKETGRSPFPIAHKIELHDFSREQAHVLQQGLAARYPAQAEAILSRIFYWTGGHPYLTQKLCLAAAEAQPRYWANLPTDQVVDRLVEKLFLSEAGRGDIDLLFIYDNVATNTQRSRLLALYRQVYEGKAIRADEQSLDQSRLKLLGLVRTENGLLKVRNLIYRQVFNLNRLNQLKTDISSSFSWRRYAAISFIVLALALTIFMGYSIYNQVQTVIAAQAQPLIENINSTTNPNVRLINLAGLFKLPGYREKADQTFFQELTPEERLALFTEADPQTVGSEMMVVIQEVYTSPNLQNNDQDNALLQAMATAMHDLVDDPAHPGAVSFELEISQWLKGREFFHLGEYDQAITSYNLAIDLNKDNPGIYFDRGLAYAALGLPETALPDFTMVLSLDTAWQTRIQQTLLNEGSIYGALWNESETYQQLAALVPTPTNTPVPTNTPTITLTPSPTGTPTRPPETPTPTVTPTFTRAPVVAVPTSSSGTGTPTSPGGGPPAGTFTLLAPLSLAEPSYGLTTFQWQWSGSLPAEYGFEVRVWKEGTPPLGVHNAVLDNQNGTVKSLGNNTYQLQTDITNASGIKATSGEYLWSVALVRISPRYKDVGLQAPPVRMLFAAPGGSGGGGGGGGSGGGGGGGGGVGIE